MVYLTGDTHGQFSRVYEFCERMSITEDDVMVILGDVGFKYHLDKRDDRRKKEANSQPIMWFCIKGNHEKYAGAFPRYEEREAFGGIVYVEPQYPRLLFAKDGEVYTFEVDGVEKKVLVIGGAYSVDRFYRAALGLKWFPDEQPCEDTRSYVELMIKQIEGKVDYVLSHTCPSRFIPVEWFLKGIDQDTVDNSTEVWLDKIYI